MKKILSLLTAVILICSVCLMPVSAKAYTGIIAVNEIAAMGDFDTLSDGYIVYFPSELTASDSAYPVAVWANGTMCPPALYTGILAGLARAGYIAIASPEMMPKDGKAQIAAIDYIIAENADENSLFYNKVDVSRIGAIGHSQGGASCVNAAAADDRIGAIVSIAGASTAEEAAKINVPSLFLAGKNDYVVVSSEWVEPSFDACTAPAVYASLRNGIHTSCILTPDTYVNYAVKWFNIWLYASDEKTAFKPEGELAADSKWTDFRAKNFDGLNYTAEAEKGFFEKLTEIFELVFSKYISPLFKGKQ